MKALYEYVVLRFSPDILRGENINIGLIVFPEDGDEFVRVLAPQAKIKAIDPLWTTKSEIKIVETIKKLLSLDLNVSGKIEVLSKHGFCASGEPGFFYSEPSGVESAIRDLRLQYISSRKSRSSDGTHYSLHKQMVKIFKHMHLLASDPDDLHNHLIVPHYPIPGTPDLKGDFVYKNGVYRITQTLDYRVSESGARQKVSEACTKLMAAEAGTRVWGSTTQKYALVNVPPAVEDIADSHLKLLTSNGFQIFHADRESELARYHSVAFSH